MREVKEEDLRDALEDLIWQFAYHGEKNGQPVLHTGGLSALEGAFRALGWDDPHVIEDVDGSCCDVAGCFEGIACGGSYWRETGYWSLCSKHAEMAREDKPQPQMKERALERESHRNKETGFLSYPPDLTSTEPQI